ncbi:site-specific integrase [bacterium]|nr:site-specific integrase [bacterium]
MLYARRLLRENGFVVEKPKERRGRSSHGRPFSSDELERFFNTCAIWPASRPGCYLPLFALLLATGARPAELVPSPRSTHKPLLKTEIDLARETVTIRSAKERGNAVGRASVISVPRPLLEMVLEAAPVGPYAFAPFAQTIAQAFDRLLLHAQIPKIDHLGDRLTAHSLRHTFGTLLAAAGHNSFVIQNLMRHKDPRMTAYYTERAAWASATIDVFPYLHLGPVEINPAQEAN